MKISAIQNVSNRNTKPLFKAGVTDFFSDFDGTFMPHKYRHDVFCNNSPSSPRKEFLESGKKDFQEYFDSFGEFLDTLRVEKLKVLFPLKRQQTLLLMVKLREHLLDI